MSSPHFCALGRSDMFFPMLLLCLILPGDPGVDKAFDAIVKKDGAQCGEEFKDAIRVNVRPEMRETLATIIAAIRYAENGSHQAKLTCKQVPWIKPGVTIIHDYSYGCQSKYGLGVSDNAKRARANGYSEYRLQVGECSATVQKNYTRYVKGGGDKKDIEAFIVFLGKKYCPVEADDLNKHWIGNVTRLYVCIK